MGTPSITPCDRPVLGAIAAARPSLVTLLLGLADWQACDREVSQPAGGLLAALRAAAPAVPLVVITPLASPHDEVAFPRHFRDIYVVWKPTRR